MFVQRGPGAEVVPSEIGGQAEDMRLYFSLGRAGFENGIVDADVFALRIKLAKRVRELARAIGGGNPFQQHCGLRKMLTQRIRQRVGAPEKHPAVPEIVARLDKLSSSFEVRLFGKASHAQRA